MSCGVPCVASRIRGNVDILADQNLFDEDISHAQIIKRCSEERENQESLDNKYSIPEIVKSMKELYRLMKG